MPQNKGAIPWNKGKRNHLSKDVLKKMSLSHKGQKSFAGKKHSDIIKY